MTAPIVVVFLTKDRTEYALRTLRTFLANVRYPELRYYVADDGSAQGHLDAISEALAGQTVIGWHTLPGGTYGESANKAWHVAHEQADLTFFLEDDWELREPLDLAPYAQLLEERSDIGMVRLGYLNLNMRGSVFGHAGRLYWLLDREADEYVFTGHPSLRHRRYREAYGAYPEGLAPGDTELGYAFQFRMRQGPGIVWPAGMAEYGVFAHIGEKRSY